MLWSLPCLMIQSTLWYLQMRGITLLLISPRKSISARPKKINPEEGRTDWSPGHIQLSACCPRGRDVSIKCISLCKATPICWSLDTAGVNFPRPQHMFQANGFLVNSQKMKMNIIKRGKCQSHLGFQGHWQQGWYGDYSWHLLHSCFKIFH